MNEMKCTSFLAEKIQSLRIAVIGDVMVDRYFYGEVKRISPEAPVPVNRVKKVDSLLGGAANVAANLSNLGCNVFVGGVTGDDDNRRILEGLLTKEKIDFGGLVKSRRRSTITKMRILEPVSRCCGWTLKKWATCIRKRRTGSNNGCWS